MTGWKEPGAATQLNDRVNGRIGRIGNRRLTTEVRIEITKEADNHEIVICDEGQDLALRTVPGPDYTLRVIHEGDVARSSHRRTSRLPSGS